MEAKKKKKKNCNPGFGLGFAGWGCNSNYGKGLDLAVPTCLLLVTYCHCTQYICNNIIENFYPGKDIRKLFWQAVHAPLESLFETYLKKIEEISEITGQYLCGIPAERWAQYAIKNPHYTHATSNIVESINGAWYLDIHIEPILEALYRIWSILMDKFYNHYMQKFMRSQDFTN
jgi:hypothetical protein